MMELCPHCGSENFHPNKAKQSVCVDCGHRTNQGVTAKGPTTALRIFLSYGHDSNEELVRQIKADLEVRGHDVWFDKNEIKFGDEWRRSITDGILKSDRVLSFLSKHSTRDPGVCRDEISIAIGVKGGNIQTILVESEQQVQPPVNIGHIQWLDMHDWKDQRIAGEMVWGQWYQAKLGEIIRVVESDESRRFAGEIETLNGHLKPINSDARISQLLCKGFCGRKWLFEAVENWRNDPKRDSRLFWIMGAPGVGKSAFAAQLTHMRGDTVIAAQFCEWDKSDHRNARRVIRSLAFQLATRLPDYRKLLLALPEIGDVERKDEAELFDYLLANPLCSVINGGRERYLIVIDALDEAGRAGRNPLVEMLARNGQRLPEWLGLVVTSRPEFDVKTPLQALNPFLLDTTSEPNRGDICEYLRTELASHLQDRSDGDRLVEQILEMSEGVFLYVERFCNDVRRDYLSLDHPEQFPKGLGGIICQYFQRQFPNLTKYRKDIRPALRAILAAREPLPVAILQKLFGWTDEDLNDFTLALGSLFPVYIIENSEVIKPYHKALADWLSEKSTSGKYYVSSEEGSKLLTDHGWLEYQRGLADLSSYFLRHLSTHLAEEGRYYDLLTLLDHPVFLDNGPFMFLKEGQLINVDFSDLGDIIRDGGRARFGVGSAKGENRAADAVKQAITTFSALGRMQIAKATRCLVNICGPKDLRMREIETVIRTIQGAVAAECKLVYGVTVDREANEAVTVSVFAGGFADKNRKAEAFLTRPESEARHKTKEEESTHRETMPLCQEEKEGCKEQKEGFQTDPMPHLLAALGRFQRYATKGSEESESWPVNCMNQLKEIAALAHKNSWPAITKVATETARILKSYDNAGFAHLSIPCLNESYEMLCLMMGDLIVGGLPPNHINKWCTQFEQAVVDLTKTGLTLVPDEEAEKQNNAFKEENYLKDQEY